MDMLKDDLRPREMARGAAAEGKDLGSAAEGKDLGSRGMARGSAAQG